MSNVERLRTQLVLRAGHLPECGKGAEFPWDCTCDYRGFMDEMGRLLALGEEAIDLLIEGAADAGPSGSANVDHRWWRERHRAFLASLPESWL